MLCNGQRVKVDWFAGKKAAVLGRGDVYVLLKYWWLVRPPPCLVVVGGTLPSSSSSIVNSQGGRRRRRRKGCGQRLWSGGRVAPHMAKDFWGRRYGKEGAASRESKGGPTSYSPFCGRMSGARRRLLAASLSVTHCALLNTTSSSSPVYILMANTPFPQSLNAKAATTF